MEQFNNNVFLLINNCANKAAWFDNLAVMSAEYLPFTFVALLIYLWLSNKNDGRNNALYASYSGIIGMLLNLIITLFYFHPRPFMNGLGTMLLNHVPETSFPSDHTTFMLSVSVTLLFLKETRKIGFAFTIIGIAGGLARVFCGIHYPLDVLGSLVVAVVSSLFVISIKGKLANINQYILGLYGRIFDKKA